MFWLLAMLIVTRITAPIIRANPVQPWIELEWHRKGWI